LDDKLEELESKGIIWALKQLTQKSF
jgi:hypothetical protein